MQQHCRAVGIVSQIRLAQESNLRPLVLRENTFDRLTNWQRSYYTFNRETRRYKRPTLTQLYRVNFTYFVFLLLKVFHVFSIRLLGGFQNPRQPSKMKQNFSFNQTILKMSHYILSLTNLLAKLIFLSS